MIAIRLGFLLGLPLIACSSAPPPKAPSVTTEHRESASNSNRDHALVGRIRDVHASRWVTEADVTKALAGATWVFLGEQHDNADHHRLQARLLHAYIAAGRRPTLVAEMLDREDQERLDAARAAAPDDPDAIARGVDWEHSGWPAWTTYRPVFAEATRAHLAIAGAGLPRKTARAITMSAMNGASALDPALVQRFGLDTALPADVQARLRDEMNDSHCGMLPESMFDAMILVQRTRDALLAEAALTSRGAVVIAGNGHVRADSGAPAALRRVAPSEKPVTVAFVEVTPDRATPDDYARAFGTTALPFDYVWFTPRASDEDHCAELRKHHAAPPAAPPSSATPPSSTPPP